MHAVDLLVLLPALVGHATLWIEFVNHVHATGMPRWAILGCTKLGYGALLLVPAGVAWWLASGALPDGIVGGLSNVPVTLLFYLVICTLAVVIVVPAWWRHRLANSAADVLFREQATATQIDQQLGIRAGGSPINRLLLSLPGNQSYRLITSEKELILPRIDSALDGLVIAHLSDLHFTGRIDKAYFQEVVRRTNAMSADLVVITGDLVDRSALIDWIGDTLAHLESKWGTYFVLGNHDKRVNVSRLRAALSEAGLFDLGGRTKVLDCGNRLLLLAGNELPWIGPAADMGHAPATNDAVIAARIVLAHTPDQYPWAKTHGFDLCLAGHTHGGQIRFPWIGPLVIPSRYGAKYAAGVFYEPPTVMHVSRGLSAERPLRFNCPPELARLILRAPQRHDPARTSAMETQAKRAETVRPLPAGAETA